MIVGDKARISKDGYENHVRGTTLDSDFLEVFHAGIIGKVVEVVPATEERPITRYRVAFEVYDRVAIFLLHDNEVAVVEYLMSNRRRWTMLSALDRTIFNGTHMSRMIHDMQTKSSVDELIEEYKDFKFDYEVAVADAFAMKDWKRMGMLKAYCGGIQYAIVEKAKAQNWPDSSIYNEIVSIF